MCRAGIGTPILSTPHLMSRFSLLLAGALAALCLLPAAVHAQTPGRIAGTVTDAQDGAPLAGVAVTLDPTRRRAVSAADGRFSFDAVAAGTYTLTLRTVGRAPATRTVDVRAGAETQTSVALAASDASLGEAFVEGRAADLVGSASSASQGRVGQAEIAPRPLLRVGEVLETVPGLIATQHSGSGKANQFFLRGFNLDHGTDFSASLEGVPMNLPTHGHGQGYLDLNSLIPELVERIDFSKGPTDVRTGDFSSAGSARIGLVRRLDACIARVEGGTDEHARLLVAGSAPLGSGDVLGALTTTYYNGPWASPENNALVSGVAKFSTGTQEDGASVTALGYYSDWNSTDQVAQRAVASGLVPRLGAIDPTTGGTTGRYTLAGQFRRTTPGASRFQATAYAAAYHLNLYSNFTYFLDNPDQGDQFEQEDRRFYTGASAEQTWFSGALGQGMSNTLGAALRHDQIFDVGLYNTTARERFNTIRADRVAETALGVYVENETRWTPTFRTTAGLRGDVYRFDVEAGLAANSGTETAFIASPRLSAVVGPFSRTEVYANVGTGFHSNDARGTTIAIDPQSGDAAERVDPLVRTRAAELGVRTAALPGLQSTLSLWTIALDSELLFVGDAGGTEASDATLHTGVEWANAYAPRPGLALTFDVALSRSRFRAGEADGDRIENSIGRIITGGVYAGRATGPQASVQLRHFGPRPLTGDDSVRQGSTTLVNARAGYGLGRVAIALDLLNVLNSKDADVSYFYASRLQGEAAEVEDVHAHPVIPRSARLSLTARL